MMSPAQLVHDALYSSTTLEDRGVAASLRDKAGSQLVMRIALKRFIKRFGTSDDFDEAQAEYRLRLALDPHAATLGPRQHWYEEAYRTRQVSALAEKLVAEGTASNPESAVLALQTQAAGNVDLLRRAQAELALLDDENPNAVVAEMLLDLAAGGDSSVFGLQEVAKTTNLEAYTRLRSAGSSREAWHVLCEFLPSLSSWEEEGLLIVSAGEPASIKSWVARKVVELHGLVGPDAAAVTDAVLRSRYALVVGTTFLFEFCE